MPRIPGILKKKESILALERYLNQPVVVVCQETEGGRMGREVKGVLKGFDSNMNLVLGEAVEVFSKLDDPDFSVQRRLGACILRGCSVVAVLPANTMKEVAPPTEWA
jgi:U6 snRNA-associated Sm-like protein LSm7